MMEFVFTFVVEKFLGIKNINLKKKCGRKYFLTHLKSPKTVQISIYHKILATNTLFYKLQLIGDPKCTFCTKTDETIENLLWKCERVKQFLNETLSWLIQHGIHITLNKNHSYLEQIQIRK